MWNNSIHKINIYQSVFEIITQRKIMIVCRLAEAIYKINQFSLNLSKDMLS